MTTYSETLEATSIPQIKELSDTQGYELRLHIGGGSNQACALVPKNKGNTYVFFNLEELVSHLLNSKKRQAEIESMSFSDLETRTI